MIGGVLDEYTETSWEDSNKPEKKKNKARSTFGSHQRQNHFIFLRHAQVDVERTVTEPSIKHFILITKAGNNWDWSCERFCHCCKVFLFKCTDIKQALEVKGNR